MTLANDILIDGFERSRDNVRQILQGLNAEDLRWRPGPQANPIGWLIWHLSRQQDSQVAALAEREQVWNTQGFEQRFGLPYDHDTQGYGQSAAQVGQFDIDGPEPLVDYHDAVHQMTVEIVRDLSEEQLAKVVDPQWDPPVTMVVRLVSVVDDAAQHCGQAAYVRGLLG